MPVPTLWSDLSQTAASNSPAGTEDRTTADDYLRQVFVYLRKLYDGESVGQLVFPATQNASSDANTLDDYEEGTWTPTDGSGAGLSLTTTNARYVKVGKLVTVMAGTITYPATASGSQAVIGGLPFTSASGGSWVSGAYFSYTSGTLDVGGLVAANATTVSLYDKANSSTATNAELTGAILYGMTATYTAAA